MLRLAHLTESSDSAALNMIRQHVQVCLDGFATDMASPAVKHLIVIAVGQSHSNQICTVMHSQLSWYYVYSTQRAFISDPFTIVFEPWVLVYTHLPFISMPERLRGEYHTTSRHDHRKRHLQHTAVYCLR